MGERIHDDELDASEATVRTLLARQCPEWSDLPLTYLRTSGTDNAMWRVNCPDGADVVVRLPRRSKTAAGLGRELALLQRLSETSLASVVRTPTVRHVGRPDQAFAYEWAVLEWLDGVDAWTARGTLDGDLDGFALGVARAVRAIGDLPQMPVARREPGGRGGPIEPLVRQLERWLSDPQWNAASLIDVSAVKRVAAESADLADEPVAERFVHGDLIPGNLLIENRTLSAIIDWGGAARADPAQDLAPAWAVFDRDSRSVFREAIEVDDATWLRARLFELEHAVGGVLYYVPRRHPLGDLMASTLHRILEDA